MTPAGGAAAALLRGIGLRLKQEDRVEPGQRRRGSGGGGVRRCVRGLTEAEAANLVAPPGRDAACRPDRLAVIDAHHLIGAGRG